MFNYVNSFVVSSFHGYVTFPHIGFHVFVVSNTLISIWSENADFLDFESFSNPATRLVTASCHT